MEQRSTVAAAGHSVIRVAWVAHKGAGAETGDLAMKFMRQFLPPDAFVMTDQHPDIILFMSGGSERRAISLTEPGQPVLLLSIRGNNAYAAATEVMARMVADNRFALLSDATDAFESALVDRWRQVVTAWRSLQVRQAGLIGSVSEWLVASEVLPEKLLKVFGVTLLEIPWSALPDYNEMEPDQKLMQRFNGYQTDGLTEAARVLTLLRREITRNELSAIAVDCFSLVQQRKVTACLALAQLNTEGVVAACEGDLVSMAGMMLVKAVCGMVPWMANTTRLSGQTLLLSHCTVAFNLVGNVTLATHYETNCSLAVKGMFTACEVTLFRLSDKLDRAFIAEGRVTGHPDLSNTCRTQVEIELAATSSDLLRKQPLGNHLLMIPGNYAQILRLACSYKGIPVIE
jgi:L-fucose isomerase-like protein